MLCLCCSSQSVFLTTVFLSLNSSRHKGSAYVLENPNNEHVKKLTDSRKDIFEDHSSRRGKKATSDSGDKKSDEPAAAEEEA